MTEFIARLHIALSDTDPLIWRKIDMPVDGNLRMLHDAIQRAMGWYDCHLWEFEAEDRRYGLPDPDWPDETLVAAKTTKLKTLLDNGVTCFEYIYDMGDDWHHVLTVETVEPGQPKTKYPRYVDGARRAPPEDIGGIPGFENFLDAIADPDHPEHRELTDWHSECFGDAYDPESFDERNAKLGLGDLAKRRAAGKAAYAKRSSTK